MSDKKSVIVLDDLAPECIARLREDGLLVDERPEWGEAEAAAGVAGYARARRRPGRAGDSRRPRGRAAL